MSGQTEITISPLSREMPIPAPKSLVQTFDCMKLPTFSGFDEHSPIVRLFVFSGI
jgi:hypothetical protein